MKIELHRTKRTPRFVRYQSEDRNTPASIYVPLAEAEGWPEIINVEVTP